MDEILKVSRMHEVLEWLMREFENMELKEWRGMRKKMSSSISFECFSSSVIAIAENKEECMNEEDSQKRMEKNRLSLVLE